ncbi:hypothetical protein QE152_g36819 [Popillia japonica]|uniref:Uncharacterized protein n=1 Tax=Popillia japonica TaxID=7064 RepID=A0AAW1ICL9_POPJA
MNILGGKEGLQRQNKAKGDVAIMTHALGFPANEGSFTQSMRYIYYPIIANEKLEEAGDETYLPSTRQRQETYGANWEY